MTTENEDARRSLAAELRRGMHLMVGREPTTAELKRIRGQLAEAFDALESSPERAKASPMEWKGPGADVPNDGQPFPDSLDRPISGDGNPFSVPMTMYRDGDAIVSTVVLGAAFEGAPGRSHGGFVSAIFDDLFGSLPMLHGVIAFTASLSVSYVAPSPVHEPVAYRGWIDRIEGKKIHVAGEARHGDVLVSTATGLFIDASEFIAANFGPPPE